MNVVMFCNGVYYTLVVTILNSVLCSFYDNLFDGDDGPTAEVCYDINEPALKYASSHTPYEFANNFTSDRLKVPEFPGCVPVKIWLLIRHGSRTPNPKTVHLMKYYLPDYRHHILYGHSIGKGDLPEKSLNLFMNWPKFVVGEPKTLTDYGKKEMYDLAKRFQAYFPHLLTDTYSSSRYNFRHTVSPRTKASAVSFARGLFGSDEASRLELSDSLDDRVLLRWLLLCVAALEVLSTRLFFHCQFYENETEFLKHLYDRISFEQEFHHACFQFQKYCRKWKKHVMTKPNYIEAHKKFLNGLEVKQMRADVSYRLGLNITLSYDDINLMYLACAAEFTATGREESPWCYMFSKKDLEVLEYALDIKHYLRDSYGNKLNYEQACPIIKDMMDYIMDDSPQPPVVLSFTHFGTISKFYAALKLFYDETPLSSKLNVQRKYRMSTMAPFSTNFALVVYRCDYSTENKVLALHQEQPITLPGCPQNELCPVRVLESNYNATRNNCNFDKICKNVINKDEPQSSLSVIKDIFRRVFSLF